MSASICAWGVLWQPPRLPTCTMRAPAGARATMASLTRSSTNSTVAAWMAFTAFRVKSSGSPGPAPTRVQLPLMAVPVR